MVLGSRVMMGEPETPIEMASRHVMEGDIRCCRQADLIGRMRDKGLDTTEAEDLLQTFVEFLLLSRLHVQRLVEENHPDKLQISRLFVL